ncbi:hypothetical protein PAHAL_3G446400 [Panicum hallii]|uniref:Uncharacterized protein n=1 Tax=Panicum hallii TaxID=206008 RepID=A0A2T8KLF4_9POAL|nr:hypothetical protein PAHAL_3G446400 [Panicum hallii]
MGKELSSNTGNQCDCIAHFGHLMAREVLIISLSEELYRQGTRPCHIKSSR